MVDLTTQIERARRHVVPAWNDERTEATVRAVRVRQRKARVRSALVRASMTVAATGATIALLLLLWRRAHVPPVALTAPSRAVAMASSSLSVVPLDAASTLVWKDALGAHAVVGVEGSGARCDVAAAGTRDVRVETGPVSVLADDAAFVVERSAGSDHVRVSVARGRVRVMWALNEASLAAGDSETFPRDAIAAVAPAERSPGAESPRTRESSGPPRGPTPHASRSSAPATLPSTAGWRDLAQQGSYDEAYAELGREGGPKDDVNDLLLAADVARLGHHPADATSPLRQILDAHRTDPRASLAAFTLGRVLLNQLGDPGSAADAFATVRSLSPGGALAEDALAREVESRAKAGQGEAARRLAQEYIQSFPASSRAEAVRRLGGIE